MIYENVVIARRAETDVAIQTRPPWLRQPANRNPPLALAQPECHPPGPMDCFVSLAMTLNFPVIARRAKTDGACREQRRTAIHGDHWGLLRRCAYSGPPGLLRDARNDVGFLSVIARRAKTDVAP